MHAIYYLALTSFVLVGVVIAMMKIEPEPQTGHCWHPTEKWDSTRIVVCCYCDLKFDPLEKIAPLGHGEFSPKTWYPDPPTVCPKRPCPHTKIVAEDGEYCLKCNVGYYYCKDAA